MQWFANLKTAAKLAIGFGLGIVLILIVGEMAFSGMGRMDKATENLITDPIPGLLTTAKMIDDMKQFRLFEFRHFLMTDEAGMRQVEDMLHKKQAQVQEDLNGYDKTITAPDDRANFDKLKAQWGEYLTLNTRLLSARSRGDEKAARALILGDSYKAFLAVADSLESQLTYNQNTADRLSRELKVVSESSRRAIIGMALLAAVSLNIIAWYIARLIARPLKEMATAAQALAVGDVQQNIGLTRQDEVGQLAEAFRALIVYQNEVAEVAEAMAQGDLTQNIEPKSAKDKLGTGFATMIHSLRTLISEVKAAADHVAHTGFQLASSADQTGKASEEIARSIQDVANAADQSATASQEIAHGSEHQAHSATAAATEMEHLHSAIAQVKQGGEQQQAAAEQASANMRQAAQAAEEVAEIGAADGSYRTAGERGGNDRKSGGGKDRCQHEPHSGAGAGVLGQDHGIGADGAGHRGDCGNDHAARRADQPSCPQCRH